MKEKVKVIEIKDIVKEYRIYTSNMQKIKGFLFNRAPGMVKTAVSGVTADVYKGDSIAIAGNHSAGRSTLMKMIAGSVYPTSGSVVTHGRITTIFDLRTGFDSELTGRENLYMRGALIGLTKQQIKEKEQEIIEFAELEDLIDLPMRAWKPGYSSRLGASISLAYKPEILLIDDSLSVRDKVFQRKIYDKIKEMLSDGETTLLMVTNQLLVAKKLCKKAWLMDGGNIIFEGKPKDVLAKYKELAKSITTEAAESESEVFETEVDFSDDEDDGM